MKADNSVLLRLWSECIEGYLWPEEMQNALTETNDLSFDESHLLKLAGENCGNGPFVLTFLTSEYFALGVLWAEFAWRSGNNRFAIAAMDAETVEKLQKRGIPAVKVQLPLFLARMVHYRNRNGFNGKALALIYCRTQLLKFLLENGVDVVSCDVDALLVKHLDLRLTTEQEIAFQRVAHFPKPLARAWGFTACAGFVAYRACTEVVALLSRVLAIQREVSSDQLALNLALLEQSVKWETDCVGFETKEEVITDFMKQAGLSIHGILPGTHVRLTALPATTFWRHKFVPLDRNVSVVLHPNSPKSIEEKLEVFSGILDANELKLVADEVR